MLIFNILDLFHNFMLQRYNFIKHGNNYPCILCITLQKRGNYRRIGLIISIKKEEMLQCYY